MSFLPQPNHVVADRPLTQSLLVDTTPSEKRLKALCQSVCARAKHYPRLPKREQRAGLKESAEERRRFIRDADDLVRCLTIKLEIELGPGLNFKFYRQATNK